MQPERALEVMEAMQHQGVVPEVITCNSLISICEKSMQPEGALDSGGSAAPRCGA